MARADGIERPLLKALAEVLTNVVVDSQAGLARNHADVRARTTEAIMEKLERELAPTVSALVGGWVDHPDLPDGFKALFEGGSAPSHQIDFLLGFVILAGMALTAPGMLAEPALTRLVIHERNQYPDAPLGVDQAAAAFAQGLITDDAAQDELRDNQLNRDRANVLLRLAQQAPPLAVALQLLQRELIDTDEFEAMVARSGIQPDWRRKLSLLLHSPPSVQDILAMVTSSWLTVEEGRDLARKNGLDVTLWDEMVETYGRPPSPEQLYELWNRGEITEEVFRRAYLESNIKNKYVDLMAKLRFRIPNQERIVVMLRKGVIDVTEGTRYLTQLGFFPADVERMVAEATSDKLQPERDLAKGEVLRLYFRRMMNRDKAAELLGSLGYDPDEADLILDLVDNDRTQRAIEAAITRTRSQYVAHRITRTEASAHLRDLGVGDEEREDLVAIWDLEEAGNVRLLTPAELKRAWGADLIDEDTYRARLVALGYTDDDAAILVALNQPEA